MQHPISTYRIQFHKGFNFDQFGRIIPYLQRLGIGTVYASPIFDAVPGSTHGYDGIHPHRINPEIGTIEQLRELSQQIKATDIQWLQDIVPNHMGFHPRNEWLMDVLEKGEASEYASYFDIDWPRKVMLPILGTTLEESIEKDELKVVWVEGRPKLQYHDSLYPLSIDVVPKDISKESLKELLDAQHYHICHWKETDAHINYRRFFTINGLICLNVQHPGVFDAYHQMIAKLLQEDVLQGLRVDHVDGLFDPANYLKQLRELAGDRAYIVVEKILQPGEDLPAWPVQGNTGYDFLAMVNNLFTYQESRQQMTSLYRELTNDHRPVAAQVLDKKAQILYQHMGGELENLFNLFNDSDIVDKRDFARVRPEEVKEAIAEFLVRCPVYRFYGNQLPLEEAEAQQVSAVLSDIRHNNAELNAAVDLLELALLQNPLQGDAARNKRAILFYQRCMQFTGPLTAKGVEDTLMYTNNRFIGHNEVGDQPASFGISVEDFHQWMMLRQHQWPYSMNATATHDTKRGEDCRARLNVITDMAEEWTECVLDWTQMNEEIKGEVDSNDEYFIYQALVASYPMRDAGDDPQREGTTKTPRHDGTQSENDYGARLNEYLEKAFREAKIHTNWAEPNTAYESAVRSFASALLNKEGRFFKEFVAFHNKVVDHGIVNSLAQLVLKFTCPGIPDVYQGCELWDLSFVDPDNRRPVDYERRMQWLEEIDQEQEARPGFRSLWEARYNGKIKLWLTRTLFQLRRLQPELFASGEYIPLAIEGSYREHVIAFARRQRDVVYVVILPLHTAIICKDQQTEILAIDWKDTEIVLPGELEPVWEDVLFHRKDAYKQRIPLGKAFQQAPFAILKGTSTRARSAGVLMHITSLPSPYGIGDMGPAAKRFADLLEQGQQRYWQVLPVNPTEGGQGHSPYSAVSGMAGNTLLISPELLAEEGLLEGAELSRFQLPIEQQVDYSAVEQMKAEMLATAYKRYSDRGDFQSFDEFCLKESAWLDDYSYFILLKQLSGGKPWYDWPEALKLHEAAALQKLAAEHGAEIRKIKWEQFIFSQQWNALKQYCNDRYLLLLGDLPIYVSYDSSDVWANREIFGMDESGNARAVAGVPPDAFSQDGQLWGMPVFDWEALKESGYEWWIKRVQRNRALFDVIRLDHFRAFAAYWEVPAGDATAKNGTWKPGPGAELFKAIQNALGELPFIAEDLGDVDDTVFALRDQFALPGMKVLQFAFGEDLPTSVHIPHNHSENFVVYTGTHDNNTTRGWFNEADEGTRHRLGDYVDHPVTEEHVNTTLIHMAYASVAKIAIIPVQDLLNLDGSARMNMPASAEGNWGWRLLPGQFGEDTAGMLKHLTALYNR